MWRCGKCRNENRDSLALCWMCGTEKGYEDVATELSAADLVQPQPPAFTLPQAAGVTRRFSVGTMMILMTFFAVLFSVLALVGAPPPVFAGVGIYFAGVGAGQMFLFRGREARKSSLVAGAIAGLLAGIVMILLAFTIPDQKGRDELVALSASFGIGFCVFGCPMGYLAGGLIAAIFLFREREERAAVDAEDDEQEMPMAAPSVAASGPVSTKE
jgi:hypothetical protein